MEGHSREPLRGEGWVGFAVVLFFVLGSFNCIDGLVALFEDESFIADELIVGNLTFWGIVMIGIGALQLYTAWMLFDDNPIGVKLGIGLATLNLVAQLFFLPAFPVWSILIMVVDVMVIYGLTVYGEHFRKRARAS